MTKTIFFLILVELVIVAVIDLKTQKIANYWSLVNLCGALICYTTLRDLYPFEAEIFLFPILTVFIGFFLYLANIMGAGDSKYLASLFFLMPPENHLIFFEKLVGATLVVGAILICWKVIKSFTEMKGHFYAKNYKYLIQMIRSSFSYAPVILLAWILLGVDRWF
jgi:prepilin peptidase CpaA